MEKSSAQNITTKTNEVSLDFSDPKKSYASSIPKISWNAPENETSFLKEGKINIAASIEAKHTLK